MSCFPVRFFGLAVLAGVVACGDSPTESSPRIQPGIEVLAGANATDTIDVTFAQALSVRVGDRNGSPLTGTVVRFEVVFRETPGGGRNPSMWVSPVEGTGMDVLAVDTTDAKGIARVRVRTGYRAGPGAVVITVPETGARDTAHYTITPGAPATVAAMPEDSAAFVGEGYLLRTTVSDRRGNVRADPVHFEPLDSTVSVDASGRLSAQGIGRGAVTVRTGELADTVWVSVVPRGSLVAVYNAGLQLMNLDGSAMRHLSLSGSDDQRPDVNMPTWTPDGERILTFRNAFARPPSLLEVDLNGESAPLLPDSILRALGALHGFSIGRNGQHLFVTAARCNIAQIVYRVQMESGATERISPPGDDVQGPGGDCWDPIDAHPSPSPDGTRLVVSDSRNRSAPELAILDVATHSRTSLGIKGADPVWSPTGEWIAFHHEGAIQLITPEGTGLRRISPDPVVYHASLNWSPDGEWLIVRSQGPWNIYEGHIELIRVADGLRLPLGFATGFEPDIRQDLF